jgi:hypothetical protein
MSEAERRCILKDLRNGVMEYKDIKGARILQTAQDKYISFLMFLKNNQPWTIGRIGDRMADKICQRGSHIVFAEEMLEAMDYTGEPKKFFSWLIKTLVSNNECYDGQHSYHDYQLHWAEDKIFAKENFYKEFDEVTEDMDTSCVTLSHTKYTKVEKRIIDLLQGYHCWDDRVIRIGVSTSASAWTDGMSAIDMDRDWLKNLSLTTNSDVTRLFVVLCHELAHDNDTTKTDIHGEDFYKNFHDICDRGYCSPLSNALDFKKKMADIIMAERRAEKKAKEDAAKAEVDGKLAEMAA